MGEAPALRAVSRAPGERPLVGACLLSVTAIVALDWATPAGVVVGILLSLPIIAASLGPRPRDVWLVFAVAAAGFVLAAAFGRGPVSPRAVWLPNRVFVILTLTGSCGIALWLQVRRRALEEARDAAIRASDTSRLLYRLLAHDLRSPLSTAVYALRYTRSAVAAGEALDPALLEETEHRLHRNVARLDGILRLVRPPEVESESTFHAVRVMGEGESEQRLCMTGRELGADVRRELEGFRTEAAALGKPLSVDVEGDERPYLVDPALVRQAISILVDNALRHARPGPIRVRGRAEAGEVWVSVADAGPASAPPGAGAETRPAAADPRTRPDDASAPGPGRLAGTSGAGLGLELCRALVALGGGSLQGARGRADGTEFLLRIPVADAPPGPRPD